MDCSNPPALTDEVLSAILDGVFDEAIREHIAQCPACAGRLAEMRRMDTLFSSLYRVECPSPQQLADFHWGFLDSEQTQLVRQHLETCPRCQDELAQLLDFLKPLPEESVENIIPLWDAEESTHRATRVDVSGNLALKGLDDKSSHDVQAGTARIYLETSRVPKGYVVSGQVVDSEVSWISAAVELWQDKILRQVGVLDETGEFRFEFAMPSPVSLYITASSGQTLAIEDIAIQT
jgi:hypothetical protein